MPIHETANVVPLGHFTKRQRYKGFGNSLTNATMVDNLQDEIVKSFGKANVLYMPDFATLYGRFLPENTLPRSGNYTIKTPLGDMSNSFIGRQLLGLITAPTKKIFPRKDNEENPMLPKVEKDARKPIRSLLMMSNGTLQKPTLEALSSMINRIAVRDFGG